MMSSMSGYRGDVMAEGSRLQPMTAHYRDGSNGLSRDYYMDPQPLDYSTKRLHGIPMSLSSLDTNGRLTEDSTGSIYKKVLPSLVSSTGATDYNLSHAKCPSPMSYSPASHVNPFSQVHPRPYSPALPTFQQLLHAPPPAPVPPAPEMSPAAITAVSSPFHNQAAVSSLILAQLQANPLLFTTLLAKSNLIAQQQQQQQELQIKAEVFPPSKSTPCPEPSPLPGFSGGSFGMTGLGAGSLNMMNLKSYHRHGDHLETTSGVLHNTTHEEFALIERSNEEYRNFRDTFLTESCKMKIRRGGRRNTTTSLTDNTFGRSTGAADDLASEGSIDVVSGDSGDGDGDDTYTMRDNGSEENNVEMELQGAGAELCSVIPKNKRNKQGMENSLKDEAYWERRRRNNEAAKRSRDARRAKEEEIAIRGAFLEQENMKLRAELSTLKSETAQLRCMLYKS